jgi:hypothetical protein
MPPRFKCNHRTYLLSFKLTSGNALNGSTVAELTATLKGTTQVRRYILLLWRNKFSLETI